MSSVYAQMEPQRIHWKMNVVKTGEQEVTLQMESTPDEHWHLYGLKDEMYPVYFEYAKSTNYSTVDSTIEFPEIEASYDELMGANRAQFNGKALFIQKFKLESDTATIKGYIDYQTCITTEDGRCLLEKQDIDIPVNINDIQEISYDNILADAKKNYKIVEETHGEKTESDIKVKEEAEEIVTDGGETDDLKTKSLWAIFWVAFGAGLIAIFTPCVLPMVPMTVTFFMKGSEDKGKGKRQALFYGVSIIIIFMLIGTIVSLTLGPSFAQWLSTHWLPNIFFFVIFLVFAAAFFGMFELRVPNWMINKSDKQADKGGLFGTFFMAFTLVLVSFSCTAPIVGAILVMAAQGDVMQPLIGMLGFGLAFALPFTLFAMFPKWLNSMPKSGGWMNGIKVILGFIELALSLKFLSVADMTYHWGLLDREIYLALWIAIFTLMGLYLLGKIKFAHDSDLPFLKVPRLALSIITFAFVVYLIPGMFGAPLKALSGWIPPMATHDFNLMEAGGMGGGHSSFKVKEDIYSKGGTPKYADVIHSPHGIQGYYDYEQGLEVAKKLNRPVFIDFSGHGCVNCRKMEEQVWNEDPVLKRLINDFIVIQLYTDDRTGLAEEDWTPANESHDGVEKKTLGDKWADMQIKRFKRNSQPQYILLNPDGEMLIKETRGFNLDVDEYVKFLDDGIEAFKKSQKK